MYQGCNKTALTSQRQISDALLLLLSEKRFSEISISEICKKASISRQTFYSLFKTKEDIISYELGQNYCFSVSEGCGKKDFSLRDLCHTYSTYIEEQYDFLKMLVDNDIIFCLHESIYSSFLECSNFLSCHEDPSRIYAADFMAQGITSIAKNYILYGPAHNTDYLEQVIFHLFSGECFQKNKETI